MSPLSTNLEGLAPRRCCPGDRSEEGQAPGQGRTGDPPQHRARRFEKHRRHARRPGCIRARPHHGSGARCPRAPSVQRQVGSRASQPWETGDIEQNWHGYFIPGTSVLRNRVGAQTLDELRDAENDLVEARIIELRESPDLLGDRTYDLAYLCAIHRQLFQDVYTWAGDLRTVGIEKDDESFCPPAVLASRWTMSPRKSTGSSGSRLCSMQISCRRSHTCTTTRTSPTPFREGNGRSTREFFDLLVSERGAGLDWAKTDQAELYNACHAARAESDLSGLIAMFAKILDVEPAYDF